MREITIGSKKIRVRATPLALLYYKQAFKGDLLGDMTKMEEVEKDMSKLDTVQFLQMIWAMAKADNFGKPFPAFEEWLAGLEDFDISDPAAVMAALEEAADGFFRQAKGKIQNKLKNAR